MTTFTTQDRQDEQRWYMVNKDGYVKPLTPIMIGEIFQHVVETYSSSDEFDEKCQIEFARAIERAHGIGE